MKAIVKYGELPGQVDYREIEEPVCGYRDVKIEIKACAICVTDLHIIEGAYPWKVNTPLGHEFCGIVVETGKGVTKFKTGDRVVACMDGGFSRYVVKDEEDWVFHLPDEISFKEGALLEPLAAAANSVFNKSHILPGDHVLIEGPGVIGLLTLQAAKLQGAFAMVSGTDSDTERLLMAKKLGADKILNVQREDILAACREFTQGRGMDTVLECSGSQAALDTGLKVLTYNGQLTQVGIFGRRASADLGSMVYQNQRIVGSIAYDRETWLRVIALVQKGKVNIKSLISHTFPLEEWEKGFAMARNKDGYRIVLIP